MSSYGDLSLDLILNSNGNIYLVFRNKRISVLDSNGNLNVKIKSIIKSGTPGTNSDNGIYCDGNNVYIKFGNDIKNITGQNSSQLPQGSIIRFKGNKNNPPAGWYYYGDTDMSGVIYIINMDVDPYTVSEVKLSWNPDSISTSLYDLGFILPTLQKQNPGNVPLSIEYSSDNPLVATIDGNGNITLKSAGSANIKAVTYANSLHNMSQASYTLTINKDEISAFFTQSSKTITVGESFTPSIIFKLNDLVYNGSVGDYYFTSDNSNIVLINGTNITGKSEGTAKIKIHLNLNNWHDSFVSPDNSVLTLTVKSNKVAVESVTVSPSSFEVLSGETLLLTATVLPSNATTKSVTWRVTQGNATIDSNGKLTAGNVTTDTTVVVEAVSNDTSGSTRVSGTSRGTIKAALEPEPESNVKSFKNIIDEFNATGIYSPNITSTGTTGLLYSYLDTMYNNAKSEYEGNSELFLSSTYENLEVYNYHGTNNQYELDGTAENAMFYWLIAMCLSELVPTSGGNNKLTRLFKFAYDLGKESGHGRKFRLYNNYTPKGDLTICRLVASVIYAKYRSNYKNLIPTFRSNLGGRTISISGTLQDGLGLSGKIGSSPTDYGYSVDLDLIFPAAAGPYSPSYTNRLNLPLTQQGENHDDFNSSTLNYVIDETINNTVVNNYNLRTSNSNIFKRAILAISDDYEEVEHYLDDKIYYTYGENLNNDVTYPHDRFTAATSSSNKGYFTGTFNNSVVTSKNLSLYKNSSNFTNFLALMKNACAYNRQTTFWPQYGRKRPSQGSSDCGCITGIGLHSDQNWLDDWGILNLAGGTTKYDSDGDKHYVDRDFPGNRTDNREDNESSYYTHNCDYVCSTTYPSGHSGGVWGAALALIELLSDMGITNSTEINNIYKAAYAFTVSRTIVRAHWNSDTIYGKLNTTTIFPVLHAMSTFDNMFNNAKLDLNNTPSNKHNIDIAYSSDWTSPEKTGFKGAIFYLPTLYIKENNTIYSSDGTSYTKYKYWDLLKQYITYSFGGSNDTNYASINSTTGAITLNNITGNYPASGNHLGDGITVFALVGENSMFTTTDAHFYINILESERKVFNVIVDNLLGETTYITGEFYFFVKASDPAATVYAYSLENVNIDPTGDSHNNCKIELPPGESTFSIVRYETPPDVNYESGVALRINHTKDGVDENYVRVYGYGNKTTNAHLKYAFVVSIDKTTFSYNNDSYRITLIDEGINYDDVLKPSTPTSSISVSPSSVLFQASGGTSSVSVTTNSSTWSATSGANWCTTNKSGNTLSISASANTGSRRTTTITITDGNNNTATVNVSQSGAGSSDTPLYSVGLLSDVHYQLPDSLGPLTFAGSAGGSDNGSFYREDLNKIINVFKANNVEFVASPGDIATSSLNELIHFTRDYIKDFTGITENGNGTSFLSNSNYRKFYCALGNHDHQAVYSDSSACKYFNYSGSAGTHVDGLRWITTASYNCPGALAGSVSYFSSNSKSYKILSSTGDVYIFLSAFYGDGGIDLTGDGKHDNSQIHPHNLMTSSLISNLKSYILLKYNNGYSFPDNESYFNFLYYKYEDLVELKNVIEANSSKKIFVFSHYFLTNKSGGNNEYPGDGYSGGASTCLMGITFHFLNCLNNIFKNVIWFTGHSHLSWKYGNAKKGLHWTNTNYKYILPTSSDNSSIWPRNANNYKNNYFIVTTGNTPYNRLTSEVDSSKPTCGWNVHLPSLSRPIESGGKNLTACEAAIMKVYDDRVEIEKLRYTSSDGINYTEDTNIPDKILTVYNDGTGECNDTAPEISGGGGNIPISDSEGIAIRLINDLNEEVRLTGALVFNVAKNPNNWDVGNQTQVKASMVESSYDQYANHISIPAGGTFVSKFMQTEKYYGQDFYDENGNLTQLGSPSYSELISGIWNMIGVESTVTRAGSLILYTAMLYGNGYTGTKDKSKINVSSGMYYAGIPDSTLILKGKTFTYHIIKTAETSPWPLSMTLLPNMSGYYTVLPVTDPISSAS